MPGTPLRQDLLFNGFALRLDLRSTSEIDIRWSHIAQRLVVTSVISYPQTPQRTAPTTREIVVLQADDVFKGAVVTRNLPPGYRMERLAAHMAQAMRLKLLGQIRRDVGRAVVREQPRTMFQRHLSNACSSQGEVERVLHIGVRYACTKFPSADVEQKVVNNGGQIVIAPTAHLELREVGLPQLIDPLCGMSELVRCFEQNESRASDEVEGFQDPVGARLRDEIFHRFGAMAS